MSHIVIYLFHCVESDKFVLVKSVRHSEMLPFKHQLQLLNYIFFYLIIIRDVANCSHVTSWRQSAVIWVFGEERSEICVIASVAVAVLRPKKTWIASVEILRRCCDICEFKEFRKFCIIVSCVNPPDSLRVSHRILCIGKVKVHLEVSIYRVGKFVRQSYQIHANEGKNDLEE